MSLGGIALVGDHSHLTYQRDLLKVATDSASIATVRHMATLDSDWSDAQVTEALQPVARRYILANIPEGRRERAGETLEIELKPNRAAGTVDIDAEADLGGAVFGRWLWGKVVDKTHTASKTERVGGVTEVALAIDVTGSMSYHLTGNNRFGPNSRMEIVKRAAGELVDILTAAGGESTAVGLVPWSYRVRFDQDTVTRWEDHGWAQYPTERYYPNPYQGSWRRTGASPYPDPHRQNPWGEWHTLPVKPGPWRGCVDQRDMSGTDPPGVSTVLPTDTPFTMGFYTPTLTYPQDMSVSFQCHDAPRVQDKCYSNGSHSPQQECGYDMPPIVPLTTDIDKMKSAIRGLHTSGSATYSTRGIAWGHRLLAPEWRDIWGDATHPVDPEPSSGAQKALVLLTDGEDNHFRRSIVNGHRMKACNAVKASGIKVFTIAAMDPTRVGELATGLTSCSSQADDPDGQYVFVNNATPEELHRRVPADWRAVGAVSARILEETREEVGRRERR